MGMTNSGTNAEIAKLLGIDPGIEIRDAMQVEVHKNYIGSRDAIIGAVESVSPTQRRRVLMELKQVWMRGGGLLGHEALSTAAQWCEAFLAVKRKAELP
jgi:hypothetical protein